MRAAIHRLVRIALVGLLVTTTSACLVSIGGCSSEEAAYFNEIEHYGGAELMPEDDGLGSCGASFTTSDDPDLVIEHYRSRLQAADWAIDPPLPSSPPASADGIEMQSVGLSARKGTIGYGVSAEIFGGSENVVVIHVGDSG
ncbi:MAG: hypothetical protein M3R05_04640 [Chloroflexota bacterium]|nr:hypothetical protein [Chloroflexota bacterium]